MNTLRVGYVGVFALGALVCFAVTPRTRLPSDPDTRRGLVALLVLSGVWGVISALQVLAGSLAVKTGLHTIGLIVGFGTVISWLAFCSAYAGRRIHRDPTVQAVTVAGYLFIVGLKLTNPIHGQYFSATLTSSPFPHLVITRLPLGWTVTTLAYVLSAYGLLLLYRTLRRTDYGTQSLWLVVFAAGLPAFPSLIAVFDAGPLLDLKYEPIGVALFAVSALYFVEEKFVSVRRIGRERILDEIDDAVLILDSDRRIVDYNAAASAAFPSVTDDFGARLSDVKPGLTEPAEDTDIVSVDGDDGRRYYVRHTSSLAVGTTTVGYALVFTDVTELERKRRELTRQNKQLDDFAAAIDHELRNALSIIEGYTQQASEQLSSKRDADPHESLAVVERTAERMADVVGDLTTLARYGQTVDATDRLDLRDTVEAACAQTDTGDVSVVVDGDATVFADADRLCELFSAAFEFACINGATTVTVTHRGRTLLVADDGRQIPADRSSQAFDYGAAVPSADAGMLLPNVRTLAAVHGWSVALDTSYTDGVRLCISGVDAEAKE